MAEVFDLKVDDFKVAVLNLNAAAAAEMLHIAKTWGNPQNTGNPGPGFPAGPGFSGPGQTGFTKNSGPSQGYVQPPSSPGYPAGPGYSGDPRYGTDVVARLNAAAQALMDGTAKLTDTPAQQMSGTVANFTANHEAAWELHRRQDNPNGPGYSDNLAGLSRPNDAQPQYPNDPNAPYSERSTPWQGQQQLSPAEIAALTPEQRAQYDARPTL